MKEQLKRIVLYIHLISIGLFVLSIILRVFSNYQLVFSIDQLVKILFYLTAIIVILTFKKQLKTVKIYFLTIVFSPLIAISSLIFGMVGVGILTLFLWFVFPKTEVRHYHKYNLYSKFGGFLKVPHNFELTETKFLIFEKKIAEFVARDSNEMENSIIQVKNDTAEIKYSFEDYNYKDDISTKKDTVLKIKIK